MTRPNNNTLKNVAFYAACFAFSVALFVALAAAGHVYPFGDNSFLTNDLKYQYIDFFAWFRRVLLGEANLRYSFSQGLGMNTWGLYSYYLASPFNLFCVLFPADKLTLFVFVISALKLGCIHISSAWYVQKRFGLSKPATFLLSASFTFCSWTISNLRNPLWIDCLILLPVCAYGCYELIRKQRMARLVIATALNVMFCWYTAYISILFLCIFVLVEFADYVAEQGFSWKLMLDRALRFAGAIVLGLLLSAWTFLPTILAMSKGGPVLALGPLLKTSLNSLIRGFLPGMWVNNDSTPQFYCGVIMMLLAVSLLFNRAVSIKTRIATLVVTIILVASSVLSPLEYIWCGMRVPNGFYSRTAFLLSFFALWAAGYALQALKDHPKLCRVSRPAVILPLLALTTIELFANAHSMWNQLYVGYSENNNSVYVATATSTVKAIQDDDPTPFYRIDRTTTHADSAALNEGLALGYDQLSSYSSVNNPQAIALLNSLGYSSVGEFSTRYAEPILAVDALLGVKYTIVEQAPAGYVAIPEPGDTASAAYGNPYALNLGIAASKDIQNCTLEGENPFEMQNDLYSKILGHNVELYTEINATKTADSQDAKQWSVTVPAGSIGHLYINKDANAGSYWPVALTIDQRTINNEAWRFDNNIRQIADASDGPSSHTVSLEVAEGYSDMPQSNEPVFYALNLEVFKQIIDELKTSEFVPAVFEDGMVEGEYTAENDCNLLLSVPYDDGWSVTINGAVAELTPAADKGMSCLRVQKGTNKIVMTYKTPGAFAGLAVSLATAAALVAAGLYARHKKSRR
ncbi:YfhO family protein [Collinsella aerofaciens]|uniref:YfhO family protein n=1 Tax=Collinsella aerofaciens TaxID=74426 RepID=A0A6N9JJS5_9ACTN|nr:YfhO family protein [Collinsella aerofaciens]MZJ39934.1 YfhO family protein [Collinsella aerofaciens]